MVVYADDRLFPEIMRMWKICFEDSDEFMDIYFRTKYRNENTLVKVVDEKAVASLQMLPYDMTFGKKRIQTAYISGACTLPEERNKRYMEELLHAAFTEMKKHQIPLTILIPQGNGVVGFYEKFGYTAMFDTKEQIIELPENMREGGCVVKEAEMKDVPAVANFCNRIFGKKDLTIQKTTEDWGAVFEDCFFSDGKIFMARHGNQLTGVCFTRREENRLVIKNLLTENELSGLCLLSSVANTYRVSGAVLVAESGGEGAQPLGMARIVDAEKMLEQYAMKQPRLQFSVKVIDKQLAWNNKTYRVHSGKCTEANAGVPDFELSVGLLTRLLLGYRVDELPSEYHIFPSENAVMSLMME
ncbi:MAG: GNAT family N-acetyltransferase [Candidatus Azobacteroides sp.]|nr:GNAT family N-acetyltransferase [Candidatus Azobacteroides sp.]